MKNRYLLLALVFVGVRAFADPTYSVWDDARSNSPMGVSVMQFLSGTTMVYVSQDKTALSCSMLFEGEFTADDLKKAKAGIGKNKILYMQCNDPVLTNAIRNK